MWTFGGLSYFPIFLDEFKKEMKKIRPRAEIDCKPVVGGREIIIILNEEKLVVQILR